MANENDNVVDIASAKSKGKRKVAESADSPLELYGPVANLISGEDYVVRACDGDDEYVWLVTKQPKAKKKPFKVVEVYPGERKRVTNLRDLRESDLDVRGGFETLSDALEELDAMIMDGIELDGTDD